jgi:hypothetical protein
MCVFLCANPVVYCWLDVIQARSERQSLQLPSLLPAETLQALNLDPMQRALPDEGHKPLDTLANAWSRLLSLVGWRR